MSDHPFNKGNAERALAKRIEPFKRQAKMSGDTIEFYQCHIHRCVCRIPAAEFEAADRPGACPHHAVSWIRFGPVMAKRPYQKKIREVTE